MNAYIPTATTATSAAPIAAATCPGTSQASTAHPPPAPPTVLSTANAGPACGRQASATAITTCVTARTIKMAPSSPNIRDSPPGWHGQQQSKKRSRRRGRYIGCAVEPVLPGGVGSTLGSPVLCGVGRTVGWPEPCGVGNPDGWPVVCGAGAGCGIWDGDVPGGAAVAQYVVTLLGPPAAATRLPNAAACCLRVPCALACAQAVHKP